MIAIMEEKTVGKSLQYFSLCLFQITLRDNMTSYRIFIRTNWWVVIRFGMQTCNGQKITFTFFPDTLGEFDPPPGNIGWKNCLSPHSFPNYFASFFQKKIQMFLPHRHCKKGVKTLWIHSNMYLFEQTFIHLDIHLVTNQFISDQGWKR